MPRLAPVTMATRPCSADIAFLPPVLVVRSCTVRTYMSFPSVLPSYLTVIASSAARLHNTHVAANAFLPGGVPSMSSLQGTIAVVTGASRGVGRAIACVLGEAGATVYVTGRSVRGTPTTDGMPGTIDDTADAVTARGGAGIAVRCDHTSDTDVEALFRRVKQEHGRLDLL